MRDDRDEAAAEYVNLRQLWNPTVVAFAPFMRYDAREVDPAVPEQ